MVRWHACIHTLFWNIGPPLQCFIIIGCLPKSSLFFWLTGSFVWAIHLAVNVVPILGYPRWLLLLLFIKHDHDLKCCVAWFIMNALNQSFIFWMLLRIVLSLIMHIVPTLVKRFSIVDLILDCQSVMNLPPVGTTLFKYMLSSIFLETIQSSRHASHSL